MGGVWLYIKKEWRGTTHRRSLILTDKGEYLISGHRDYRPAMECDLRNFLQYEPDELLKALITINNTPEDARKILEVVGTFCD